MSVVFLIISVLASPDVWRISGIEFMSDGEENIMVVPQHVAIIVDGNGRWAKSKGMPRNYGHVRGAKNLEVICRDAYNMGIKYLTVYLFSTEN